MGKGLGLAASIRVFSGNLWWGRADSDALVELIREFQIDVFAAQELGFENAEAISSELGYGMLEPDDGFQGMGIAMRSPASYERIPMAHRDARRAVLKPKDWVGLESPIDLINVHFQAPHSIRPFPAYRVRGKQVAALERFDDAYPSPARVLLGDFNATPAWPLYRRLAKRFEDGAVQSAKKEGRRVEASWGYSAQSRRLLRIDHTMVRGVDVENFRIIDIPGSDHSGMLFDCSPRVT